MPTQVWQMPIRQPRGAPRRPPRRRRAAACRRRSSPRPTRAEANRPPTSLRRAAADHRLEALEVKQLRRRPPSPSGSIIPRASRGAREEGMVARANRGRARRGRRESARPVAGQLHVQPEALVRPPRAAGPRRRSPRRRSGREWTWTTSRSASRAARECAACSIGVMPLPALINSSCSGAGRGARSRLPRHRGGPCPRAGDPDQIGRDPAGLDLLHGDPDTALRMAGIRGKRVGAPVADAVNTAPIRRY